ncbi:MAG: hypothetical protein KJ737_10845 [Proteobacteria bacterium]|nr:hypothetical protein [Pseudomonadota bacterium]
MTTKNSVFIKTGTMLIVFIIYFFWLVPCINASPSIAANNGRFYEPVEIPGKLVPDIVGSPLEKIIVFAFRDNQFRPIVFQIDEVTGEGSFILSKGPEANNNRSNQVYDEQDLIAFMVRDTGEKAPIDLVPEDADKTTPVALIDPSTGEETWVYISTFKGDVPTVTLEPIISLFNRDDVGFNVRGISFGYDGLVKDKGKKKASPTIFIDKFWVNEKGGGNNENIFDRQKVRGRIRFMGGLIKVPFSEGLVKGGITAYKEGPVRIITHSCMYPAFPLGIKGPRFYIDSIMVDSLTLTKTIMGVPFNPGALISDITLSFGMDLSENAKGMTYYSSENLEGFLIDGIMSKEEKDYKNTKNSWCLITGPQGTQITATVFDPNFLKNGKAFSTYNDDEKDEHPPENFKGDIGAMFDQLVLKGLASGKYYIDTTGCVPSHFYREDGFNKTLLLEILNAQKKPLKLKAGEIEITNGAMSPRELIQTNLDS